MMVIRGLAGLLIGVAYGFLVGAVVYPLSRIGIDPDRPGPLIPNPIEMAWWVTLMAGFITGACGAVVGLVVGLLGVEKAKAAKVGFISGTVVIGLLIMSSSSAMIPYSLSDVITLLLTVAFLPFGVALLSVVVAIVTLPLKRYDL